ncbi:hypothetical protein [Neptuniibacter sp. QD37_11]|uniref:hypothetical protein n=1 Tax=Neptuniibacter sp. QD37_11 TaxID=3398209 RepID=UPI0039F45939
MTKPLASFNPLLSLSRAHQAAEEEGAVINPEQFVFYRNKHQSLPVAEFCEFMGFGQAINAAEDLSQQVSPCHIRAYYLANFDTYHGLYAVAERVMGNYEAAVFFPADDQLQMERNANFLDRVNLEVRQDTF